MATDPHFQPNQGGAMWGNKQPAAPSLSVPSSVATAVSPVTPSGTSRAAAEAVRSTAWLGPSIHVKGEISGDEPLQIDGTVEGPISLEDHRLTVGRTAKVTAEVVAREVVVHGKINGNVHARDRIEIKNEGSVIGDLTTARIRIEDGAYFKGKIEIERTGAKADPDVGELLEPAARKLDLD